jgi:hypothetical protein
MSAWPALAPRLIAAFLVGCAQQTPPPPATGPTPAVTSASGTTQAVPASTTSALAKAEVREDASTGSEPAARAAAEAWLSIVDAGKYAQSWTEASTLFRRALDQPSWEKALNGARAPLGAMRSRALKSAKYATSLPGAPDGEYVVVLFETSFENKQHATETVTPMKDADGRWRVSGYFVK